MTKIQQKQKSDLLQHSDQYLNHSKPTDSRQFAHTSNLASPNT